MKVLPGLGLFYMSALTGTGALQTSVGGNASWHLSGSQAHSADISSSGCARLPRPPRPPEHRSENSLNQMSTNIKEIKTGEYVQVPQSGRVTHLGTGGLGCCVALAMRGDAQEDGQSEVFLAHLDSQQYTPPGHAGAGRLGGKTDAELLADDDVRNQTRAETMIRTRKFARTHNNLQAIAVTNYQENPLNIGQCLFLKLSVAPPPDVYFLDEPKLEGGRVVLDVPNFEFYKVDPVTGEQVCAVEQLQTMDDVVAQRQHHGSERQSDEHGWWQFWRA